MAWPRDEFELWHGTDEKSALNIVNGGVRSLSRAGSHAHLFCDFGPGFYTTPNRSLAEMRAVTVASQPRRDGKPMLVRFAVALHHFARLEKLAFVSGGKTNEMFWWFVHSCREGAAQHDQARRYSFPAVIGPVVGTSRDVIRSRSAIPNSEQVSFHGQVGIDFINKYPSELVAPSL